MSQAITTISRAIPPRFVRCTQEPMTRLGRWVSALIFTATMSVLVTAHLLQPSSSGMGTHEQLGLPPCGFQVATNVPCATCGMTTSFSLAAHGQLGTAFLVQPAGAVLALATAAAALISGYALVVGMSLVPLGRRLWQPAVVWTFAGLIVAGWLYKIVLTLYFP